ncbi:MAG: hypothetical protein JJT90_11710 [Ectothiorhodospiraceae bacterium]|nr:hypothetical protein [Ectothiorhodospiraceae bacterium]
MTGRPDAALSGNGTQGVGPVTDTFRGPLLEAVLGRLRPKDRWLVLDLGQASAGTLAFFSQARCWLGVADLGMELDALPTAPAALQSRFEALLPRPRTGEPVDLVLGWELCNYLPATAMTALVDTLRPYVRPGALFHQLLGYAAGSVPRVPSRFVLQSNASLKRVSAPEKRPGSPPTLQELESRMGECRLRHSVLLRNGLQECLSQWPGGDTATAGKPLPP